MNKYSGNKIKESEMDWACNTYGGEKGAHKGFGGKKEGKGPLGRHKGSWENSIKINFQEVRWDRGLD